MMAATKPTTSDCCRKIQQENNELRDLVISMKLSINILENIKRLSNDYIDKITPVPILSKHQDATHANLLKKFQTTLNNIKKDLRYWNKKYDLKISFDKSCGDDQKITSIFSDGNNPKEGGSNSFLQSNPSVANPSEGIGLDSAENVGTNAVAVAGNHDHHDHDHGPHKDDDIGEQNNSEHLKSNGGHPLIQLEPGNEQEKECANNPNDDEDENDVDGDRYLQRNGSNRLKSGDMHLPTELCEMSLKTTSDSTQNCIDNSCEMSNLQDNTSKNDHSKGGRETGAFWCRKTSTGALASLKFIKITRGDSNEKNTDVRLFERLSQTKEKSSSDGGAHSSAHHSKSTTFNSIHSKSTSIDQASMVNSNPPSIIYNRTLDNYTTSNIHGPMFLCDHKDCGFKTNTKQRLSMHKRTHAGEILYHCDVAGCDYISNYKGNVKIHKKHKHRFGSGSTGNKTTGCGEKTAAAYLEQDMITISDDDDDGNGDNGAAAVATAVVQSSASNPSSIMMDNNPPTNARGRKRSFSYSFLVQTNNTDNENVPMSSADLQPPAKAGTAKEQPNKEYPCKVDGCSYSTKWKQCLQAHDFLHAGIKPYKCDYPGCEYRTNFKGNVNVHKRQHSGTTSLFRCGFPGCGFSTPWKNSFATHKRNHRNQQQHSQQTPIVVHLMDNNNQLPSIDKSLLAANKSNEMPQSSNVNDDPTTSDNLIIQNENEDQEQQIMEQILNENQEKLSIKNNRNRIYWPTKTGK